MEYNVAIYDGKAYNDRTAAYDIWKGAGTREAIAAAGFRYEPWTQRGCRKELLEDGWSFRK
jgi:hypothetical protein